MKNYSFLLKPLFFIFNLLFATWLVLFIEKLKPSDFGKHKSIFESAPKPKTVSEGDKHFLKNLVISYKLGKIDSLTLEKELDRFVSPLTEPATKEITEK
jgi:hypothetical protein